MLLSIMTILIFNYNNDNALSSSSDDYFMFCSETTLSNDVRKQNASLFFWLQKYRVPFQTSFIAKIIAQSHKKSITALSHSTFLQI